MFPSFYVGGMQVFTYPLILGVIWALAYHISKYLLSLKKIIFPHFNLFFAFIFIFVWLGAKLLFLLTLEESLAQRAIDSSNFWLGGGFVFYGGLLGGLIFCFLYSKKFKIPIVNFSFAIPVVTLGHGLGRVACFMAGCCYGNQCDLPWRIYNHGLFRHPVQLYESFLLFVLSMVLLRRFIKNKPIIVEYLLSYALIRFTLEFFRGDSIRGVYAGGLSTSQILAIFIALSCVAYKVYQRQSK